MITKKKQIGELTELGDRVFWLISHAGLNEAVTEAWINSRCWFEKDNPYTGLLKELKDNRSKPMSDTILEFRWVLAQMIKEIETPRPFKIPRWVWEIGGAVLVGSGSSIITSLILGK